MTTANRPNFYGNVLWALTVKKPSYYEVIICEFLESLESLTNISNFFELAEENDFPCWSQSVKYLRGFESCLEKLELNHKIVKIPVKEQLI